MTVPCGSRDQCHTREERFPGAVRGRVTRKEEGGGRASQLFKHWVCGRQGRISVCAQAALWSPLSVLPPLAGYSFPMMITRCHNLGGLEQWEHVLSRFWSPEAQSQVTSGPHHSAGSFGSSFLASSRFWWLQAVLGSRLHHSAHCLCLHMALSHVPSLRMVSLLHVCVLIPLFL